MGIISPKGADERLNRIPGYNDLSPYRLMLSRKLTRNVATVSYSEKEFIFSRDACFYFHGISFGLLSK